MDNQDQTDWFQDVETIVSEPLNFKAKLAIGEDAYTSLKVKNAAFQAWEVAGVATTAVVVATGVAVAVVNVHNGGVEVNGEAVDEDNDVGEQSSSSLRGPVIAVPVSESDVKRVNVHNSVGARPLIPEFDCK